MYKAIDWGEIKDAHVEQGVAILDANILFFISRGGARPERAVDIIRYDFVCDTIFLPNTVVRESKKRWSRGYERFVNDVGDNEGVFCYEIRMPFNLEGEVGDYLAAFRSFESGLNGKWRDAGSLVKERKRSNGVTDKTIIYTALEAKRCFPQSTVKIVSDDRRDIRNDAMRKKLEEACEDHLSQVRGIRVSSSNSYHRYLKAVREQHDRIEEQAKMPIKSGRATLP